MRVRTFVSLSILALVAATGAVSPAAEMKWRREVGLTIAKVEDQFSNLPDYAGAWMDQAHGGVVVVAFTDNSQGPERQAAIAAIVPTGSPFHVADATYSLATLNSVYQKISADQAADTKIQALHIVQSAVDTQNNRIVVALDKSAPADSESAIAARYNFAGLVVSRGSMSTSSSSRDIRSGRTYGGLWTTDGSENCTIGYSDAKSATEQTYSLTAGHCGPNGTSWIQGLGGSRTIGQVHANSVYGRSSTNCDCAPIGVLASGFGTSGAYLAAGNVRLLTAAQTRPYQNEALCQFGAASADRWGGIVCGNVAFASSTTTESGSPAGTFTLTDALQSNVRSTAGDSGGTYVDGTYLLAIQSSQGDPNGIGGWVTWASKPANFGTAGIHLAFASV